MTDAKFISPTMDWIYDRNPNWVSDDETMYKLGFAKRTMVDVHGFDAFGFNAEGVDRLGCSRHDYSDLDIMAIGQASGEWMSLSNKLPIQLPKFLKLKPMLERLCRERWEVEPTWVSGIDNLLRDGKKRFYTHMTQDFSIGLHWYDLTDCKDNYLTLTTDVIAKIDSADPVRDLYFRIVSRGQSSDYELAQNPICVSSIEDAFLAVKRHINDHLQPVHSWSIRIVDTPEGPALAAYSAAELKTASGDLFAHSVTARTREDALQMIMDNAKTSAVESMASAGIQQLIGHPAVVRGPRI
jgi:hypothetical protein